MSEWVHPLPGKRKQSVKNRAGTKESLAVSGFTLTLAPRLHQPGPVQDPGPDRTRHCLRDQILRRFGITPSRLPILPVQSQTPRFRQGSCRLKCGHDPTGTASSSSSSSRRLFCDAERSEEPKPRSQCLLTSSRPRIPQGSAPCLLNPLIPALIHSAPPLPAPVMGVARPYGRDPAPPCCIFKKLSVKNWSESET